jgi:hypothetical protein
MAYPRFEPETIGFHVRNATNCPIEDVSMAQKCHVNIKTHTYSSGQKFLNDHS